MAHLRDITRMCEAYGCTSRASVQVFSFRNEGGAVFCKKHSGRALKQQLERERAYWKQVDAERGAS